MFTTAARILHRKEIARTTEKIQTAQFKIDCARYCFQHDGHMQLEMDRVQTELNVMRNDFQQKFKLTV